MLLASKAAWTGIVFLLLMATGISGPRQPRFASAANLSKEVPPAGSWTDIRQVQETLRGKGHYRGQVDGVFGLRTRAGVRAYQKAENLPVTGQLDPVTAGKLGVRPEGRQGSGDEPTKGKPSAYIKWAKGSGPSSRILRKTVKIAATPDNDTEDREKPLQAENHNRPQ